ncbi:unnamed protein product, partial [Rotaria socialis]
HSESFLASVIDRAVPKRPQYPNAEDRITTSNTKPLSHNQRFGTVTITSAV